MKLNTEKMIAEVDGGIGWMIFNNPERRNAMSLEMWEGVATILTEFERDDSVRVIVMKGAGDKAFVSGADISQFEKERSDAAAAANYSRISEAGREKLTHLKKPLVAMIRGFCLGGGLGVAMQADVRIASDDSQFGIPAARLGIAYTFLNLRQLVDLVGPSRAKDILFTGRRLDAAEALAIGLVNRVVPAAELESVVRDYAKTLAENAPLSIRGSKATIQAYLAGFDGENRARLRALSMQASTSEDYREGTRAFLEKRRPTFQGR